MLLSNQKTSILIPSQLPAFIRDNPNYANFVTFLQAYYEWLETQDNITDVSKNLLNYHDVDNLFAANTSVAGSSAVVNEFINYFQNDFLSYFPKNILANQAEVIKLARQLYQSKGTPASYQFLFRVLYNTDVDFFITGDATLKASGGSWYVPLSLRLESNDTNFLSIKNLRVFGTTSKSIATVENSVLTQGKIEVFISNVERLFQSGEFVNIVDSNNQLVYFLNGNIVPVFNNLTSYPSGSLVVYNGVTYEAFVQTTPGILPTNNQYWAEYGQQAETLSSKIVGQISQIIINKNYRGLYYQPGDPVIVYNGLANVSNPHGAVAEVGSTTTGSIQDIKVVTRGYGYTNYPNTIIEILNAPGAIAIVGALDPAANSVANATFIPTDIVSLSRFTTIGNTRYSFFSNNITANANTTLANAFNFTAFTTYPIAELILENGGGGVSVQPPVTAISQYPANNNLATANLASLGILAPIQISNAGLGYRANDTITISGGTGRGAYANVLTVNANGSILSVGYVYNSKNPTYPLGGLGYNGSLPTLNVVSSNTQASNASLYVPGILGTGATFYADTDRAGQITTINILDYGQDYVAAPNVSLQVQDILVTGFTTTKLPKLGDIVYQGTTLNTASYYATVNNTSLIVGYANSQQSIYNLRVFNYNTPTLNLTAPLKSNTSSGNIAFSISTQSWSSTLGPLASQEQANATTAVLTYGDGKAQATATFLNGLTIGQGQYLNDSGQLSGFDVLQSTEYNNYTYEITLEKEIAKYRDVLLGLLHPAGTQIIGRFAMKSNNSLQYTGTDALLQGYPLSQLTGAISTGTISGTFANPSNNTIWFNNLAGANLQSIIFANSIVQFTSANGDQITSGVVQINDGTSNNVVLTDNVWMAFANVAYGTTGPGTSTINISSVWTSSYNIVNDGNYSNTMYPLMDMIRAGDTILANNQTKTVSNVNYVNNIIYLNGNLTYGVAGNISVSRTWTSSNIQIFGPVGIQYIPELITEDGRSLTDEQNNILILG